MLAAALLAAAPLAAIDEFSLYTDPITLLPGQVHNYPTKPLSLPDEIVQKFAGNSMGVVKFQLDIVKDEGYATADEKSMPLTMSYNHHTIQAMGTRDKIKQLYDTWAQGDPLGPTTLHAQWRLGGGGDEEAGGVWMGPVGGAEYRNADRDLAAPYRAVVDSPESFTAVVHVINTNYELQPNDWPRVFECPCTSHRVINVTNGTVDGVKPLSFTCTPQLLEQHNNDCELAWYKGGYRCCENGAFLGEKIDLDAPKDSVRGKFTIRFDDQPITLAETKQVFFHQLDVAGANAEYEIPGECKMGISMATCKKLAAFDPYVNCSDPCTHIATDEIPFFSNLAALDPFVKSNPFADVELITARGHQHVAGIGMELFNAKTNELLCASTPLIGDGGKDEPGNEHGYIVGIPPCVWGPPPLAPPPRLKALDMIRIVSRYNASEKHYGVMGFWFTQMSVVKPNATAA